MKTMILAAALAAVTVTATAAVADDFDNTTATVSAEWNRFTFEVEGAEDDGYVSATVGAEVLAYSFGEKTNSALDVYLTHYHDVDELALGAEYTVTYAPNALSVYGAAQVEYGFDSEAFEVTPTVGAAYEFTATTTAWGEVGYTWNATDDWARVGGVAEIGVDFVVADNITLTPSVVHKFDRANGSADESQLNLGVSLKF